MYHRERLQGCCILPARRTAIASINGMTRSCSFCIMFHASTSSHCTVCGVTRLCMGGTGILVEDLFGHIGAGGPAAQTPWCATAQAV